MKFRITLFILILFTARLSAQIDSRATEKTRALYYQLFKVGRENLLFGHQDDTAYGVGWSGQDGRSDVMEVCGDYPAVYGWDLGDIGGPSNLDGVSFTRMKRLIREAHARGGVITLSMHLDNPYTGFSAWDNREAVPHILPGGSHHESYLNTLDLIGGFINDLRSDDGAYIPVILRPYHEHTQTWSWWGSSACTSEEYIALWKMTVHYLKDTLDIHHILYAISPQDVSSAGSYFYAYPGDDYVDVLGLDWYGLTSGGSVPALTSMLTILGREGDTRGKVTAVTEIGVNGIPLANWWTGCLWQAFNANVDSRKTAWALVWRNASSTHHFAPYPGHSSAPDFIDFYNKSNTRFEADLPDMYVLSTADATPPVMTLEHDSLWTSYSTTVTLRMQTDERAYIRYALEDKPYDDMEHEFQSGQGGFDHRTDLFLNHGRAQTIFIRAEDPFGNRSGQSAAFHVRVDTSRRPVFWWQKEYDDSQWLSGAAPLGYNASGLTTDTDSGRTLYFRKRVRLPVDVPALGLLITGQDGFIVRFNEEEIRRMNMPPAETVDYETDALSRKTVTEVIVFDETQLAALRPENLIAVEVHSAHAANRTVKLDARLFNNDTLFMDLGSEWMFHAPGTAPETQIIDKSSRVSESPAAVPRQFTLGQNYPNPFQRGAVSTIEFGVKDAYIEKTAKSLKNGSSLSRSPVTLKVYNVLGQCIQTLFQGHAISLVNRVTLDGSGWPCGVYFYTLQSGADRQTRKMLILR